MKISIIIPVYNVEKYLEGCLDSAVNQTLDKIEIICINDGSTDGSLDILKKYRDIYKNIVIVDKQNGGQSSARNAGLKIARGEYIYFLDSDDFIDVNMCKECYELCIKNNLDIISFDAHVVYENEKYNESSLNRYYERCNSGRKKVFNSSIYNGQEFYNISIKNSIYVVSVCRHIFKKSFLVTNHILFDEGIVYEDNIFSTKAIILAKNITYINKDYFYRRMRENSTMNSKYGISNVISYFIVAKQLYKFSIDEFEKFNNNTIKNLRKFIKKNCNNAISIYNKNNINNEVIIKDIKKFLDEI